MNDDLHDLNEVLPGDLITAEFINTLIRYVKGLSVGGPVEVPSFFSRTLRDAKSLLLLPGNQLTLGTVLDAAGFVVDPSQSVNDGRLIINQVPPPNSRVAVNTGVHLVLAAAGGGTVPQPAPKITSFNPLTTPIGGEVQIVGENFALSRSDNKVTFDGVDAGVPSALSSLHSLFVVVPTGIPNAPSQPGQQKTVTVTVTTPQGSASAQTVILPPLPQPLPQITPFAQNFFGHLGKPLIINGQNFGSDLGAIRVFFDGTPAGGVPPDPSSTLPTKLNVTIPNTINVPGTSKIFAITVRVGTLTSPAVSLEIFK